MCTGTEKSFCHHSAVSTCGQACGHMRTIQKKAGYGIRRKSLIKKLNVYCQFNYEMQLNLFVNVLYLFEYHFYVKIAIM